MIRTIAVMRDGQLRTDLQLKQLESDEVSWYWVDFDAPSEQEAGELERHFHFHPLTIEDCFHLLQRPKLDHYEDVHFFVLHAIDQVTLTAEEVDVFLGRNFLVTFHLKRLQELDNARNKLIGGPQFWSRGPLFGAYLVMDKLVDEYFPTLHELEDQLGALETNDDELGVQALMNRVFAIRAKLLKLRRSVVPMRDLLYRTINSQKIEGLREQQVYFTDVHDHLIKLSEMLDQDREMTSDMRDSYLSLNSNRMNHIMKTLTVITTIFMPLTFIAGIYGMNFAYMPELEWKPGYFIVLGVMAGIGVGMFGWFRRKGWFE